MFARSIAALLVSSLVVACTDLESEAPHEPEEIEVIDEVLRFGGELVLREPVRFELPACGHERLCVPGVEMGCCESEEGPTCFTCERPAFERPESECQRHVECGDEENARCAVEDGVGVCYRLCGGREELGCEEDEACMRPPSDVDSEGLGVCREHPAGSVAPLPEPWFIDPNDAVELPTPDRPEPLKREAARPKPSAGG
jgi:hypothetical protein